MLNTLATFYLPAVTINHSGTCAVSNLHQTSHSTVAYGQRRTLHSKQRIFGSSFLRYIPHSIATCRRLLNIKGVFYFLYLAQRTKRLLVAGPHKTIY